MTSPSVLIVDASADNREVLRTGACPPRDDRSSKPTRPTRDSQWRGNTSPTSSCSILKPERTDSATSVRAIFCRGHEPGQPLDRAGQNSPRPGLRRRPRDQQTLPLRPAHPYNRALGGKSGISIRMLSPSVHLGDFAAWARRLSVCNCMATLFVLQGRDQGKRFDLRSARR